MHAAWGNAPIQKLPTNIGNNQAFVFQNVATPDGQWLVGTIEPRDFVRNTTQLSYLALYNVQTREVRRIHPLLQPQSQVLGASIDDHWLAWSEAPDQPSFFDWTMFLYNRETGQVTQLAAAPHVNGQAVSGASTPPVVSHNHVIWSQPTGPVQPGNDASLTKLVVYLKDLSTGTVTTLATKAGECNLSWPWASWGQIMSGGGYVVFKNLVTGQQEQLQEQPATIALDGASVAFDDLTSAYLIDNIAGGTQNVRTVDTEFTTASGDAQHLQFVTVNDRLVAWNLDTGPVAVWDRIQHRLVQLPSDNGTSAAWVAGPLLIWLVPEPAAQQKQDEKAQLIGVPTLDVLDTTTLPTAPPAP